MKKIEQIAEGKNFTAVTIGNLDQISEHGLMHPVAGLIKGKVFLKDATNATSMQISYNVLPPKTDLPYFHSHNKNEESYLILSGAGKFQVDDHCFDIAEGSVVRVAPAGKRGMTNTSSQPMIYIVIQSKEDSLQEYSAGDGKILEIAPMWK